MSIKLHSVTSQQGKHVTAVRSSDLTTSRWWHLLTCSQTPWQSNYSHIQQSDIWIYNGISIRFWQKFQGIVECHINCDLRFSRWWLWCWLSPWSSHFKPVDMLTTSERNLRPSSPWRRRRQLLWNAGAYPQDCTVPQLRGISVSDQCGVHKTNSNNFHVYTLSKLRFIQSCGVMQCGQGWDMSTWEFRIWSPCPVSML